MTWRIDIGSAVLYGICDARSTRDPLEFLIGSTPDELARYPRFLNADGTMQNSFSCYLFDTGQMRVMVDTGFGYNAPDGVGDMPDALRRLGVSPGDIDHVVFTHLHPDHILGSLDPDGAPLFGDAAHWTLRREVEHWRGGSDDRSRHISGVADVWDGAGLLNAVEDPGEVVPGVTTFATFGHSPGHTSVRLSSGDDEIVITGDVTTSPAQVDHPEWAFPFDGDKPQAVRTRAEFFDMVAESGVPFAAGHYPQPGYGRVVVTAEGRRYEALAVTELD